MKGPKDFDRDLRTALGAAKQGDRAAFAQFVGLTQRMLNGLALSITSDPAVSEDIAQEACLETWKRLPSMDTDASALPWLRHVVRSKSIDVLRRRRRSPALTGEESLANAESPQAQPQDTVHADQQTTLVLEALATLPESTRVTVLLYYREGERTQNVAVLLGVSDAVIRKRLQRAREQLREHVEARIKSTALSTAPKENFAACVVGALGLSGTSAAPGGVIGLHTVKSWITPALSAGWAALAALGLVFGAVAIDTRIAMARTQDPLKRRRLLQHGVVYGLFLGGYLLALDQAASIGWSKAWLAGLAVCAVFALTYWRSRILR